MSLSEERMMILKMLQEGRINSEEAAKLLEALDAGEKRSAGSGGHGGTGGHSGPEGHRGPGGPGGPDSAEGREGPNWYRKPPHNYYDEVAKFRERINEWRRDFSKNYNQKDFDKMVDEFSAKAEKVGKEVANVTYGVVDKMVDFVGSFVEAGAYNIFGSYGLIEKTYEAPAADGISLLLQANNGPIAVKKHQEENILIKAKIRTPQNSADDVLVFSDQDTTVSLMPANPDSFNLSIAYEVFVPSVRFNKLTLQTKNSKIYVEDTLSQEFTCITKNAAIDLTGITSEKITADTKNAKILCNYLIAREISLDTKNAMIDIKNMKAEKLSACTANGKLLLENLQHFEGSSSMELDLRTKNADIKANMNDPENNGYKVKARTTNGGINLLIPDVLYRNNPEPGYGKQIDAETEHFADAPLKVQINAETLNGYIEIIK